MSERLTDKRAVWVALCTAVQWEEGLIDANTPPGWSCDVQDDGMNAAVADCKRRIAAYDRVALRYYGETVSSRLAEFGKGTKRDAFKTLMSL